MQTNIYILFYRNLSQCLDFFVGGGLGLRIFIKFVPIFKGFTQMNIHLDKSLFYSQKL